MLLKNYRHAILNNIVDYDNAEDISAKLSLGHFDINIYIIYWKADRHKRKIECKQL